MVQQTLFTVEVPALGNVAEGVPVTVATTVTFAVDGTLDGIQVYAPATVTGTFSGAAWEITADDDPTGAGTLIGTVAIPSLTPSSWQTFAFSSPIPVLAGKAYRIGLRTSEGRYTATGAGFNGAGMTNGDISAPQTGGTAGGFTPISNGTFGSGVVNYPNQTFNGNKYFVGPVFSATVEPAEGDAALSLALAVATAGARASQGAVGLGLGLALAADGARASEGDAALGLALAVAAAGARPSAGSAAFTLDLALATTGGGLARGEAAFTLDLALAATGPGSGCSSLPSFPWACTSVPSFSEVRS